MKSLKTIFDEKLELYKQIETNSSDDLKNEPLFREKLATLNMLLKELCEYNDIKQKIQNEEQNQTTLTKKSEQLDKSIKTQNTLISELKNHMVTLREKRETELLIIKYENDREKIKEGDECFLCGSTSHPYITHSTNVDLNSTNTLLDEKELLCTSYEKELKSLETKKTQIVLKRETSTLELKKQNDIYLTKKEIFTKESLVLSDDTKTTLEEKKYFYETKLNEIVTRREEKEKILKEKEQCQEKYTSKQTIFLEKEKELETIILNEKQNEKDELNSISLLQRVKIQLELLYKKFEVTFEEQNYKHILEKFIEKNDTFKEYQTNLMHFEEKKNSYDLTNTQNAAKLNSLIDELVSYEENRVELESIILSLKEESIEILNIADINMFEHQIKTSFEKVQKIQSTLSVEFSSLLAKIDEYEKQQKNLSQEIVKNKVILEELNEKLKIELKNNDFENIETLQNALLPKEQRDELFLKCKKIEDDFKKYQTLKNDTIAKLLEHAKEIKSEKSLEEIQTEFSEVKTKSDTLQLSIGEIQAVLKRDEEDRAKNKEKILELEKKQESFKVWVKLNEMIGSADGNKFAKFAQGITLDQLINLANNHLSVLSSRYELQRSSEQKQLLEIEVCDSFQGDVIRPVSTLSGGESFIVSLSLALGLSELASQKIAIDSLFLDEGFGTLDEDSLETALNALNLLQSSGKMVGVISHVEALKERIPLQIKVMPKGDGTSTINIGS